MIRSYGRATQLTSVQIPEPVCGITSVAFSVSGRLLFAGYDDFECKVRLFASHAYKKQEADK
jgi:hypothetical protein